METVDFIEKQTDIYMSSCEFLQDIHENITGCRIDYRVIEGLHPVLRKSIIRRAFEKVAGRLKDVEEVHILDIDGLYGKQSGRKLSLPYGIMAIKEYDHILLKKSGILQDSGTHNVSETSAIAFSIHERSELGSQIPNDKDEKWFDYEKLGGIPEVRTQRKGDFLLIGSERHKKSLNRFMIDNKIPQDERNSISVLAIGSHVIWVIGYRQDESCLITSETEKVLVAKKKDKKGKR